MRLSRQFRLVLLVSAVATTLVVGAKSVTNAAGGVDPLDAEDIDYAGAVYRDSPYVSPAEQVVTLEASGGSGAIGYRVVEPPTSAGDVVGTVEVTGDRASVTIEPTAEPGPATFRYQAHDEEGRRSGVATVSFEISNRAPQTRDLALTTPRDTPLDLWPYARDPEDGGPFPWHRDGNRIRYGDPAHGTVRPLSGDRQGGLTTGHKAVYVPDPGYVGRDTFAYTFADTEGGSTSGEIVVDVREPSVADRAGRVTALYRCPLRIGADGAASDHDRDATEAVARVLGGDLLFRVRARAGVPQGLRPGERYRPRIGVDLSMSRSTAAMLAGDEVSGDGVELGRAGLGQTSIATDIEANLTVTDTATGTARQHPVSTLKSGPVTLTLPVPDERVALPAHGTMPELTAPESGSVVVSMPRSFDLGAVLEPGVQGVLGSVGMHCRVVGDPDLELATTPVRVPTRITTATRRITYGKTSRLPVRVSAAARGRARVFDGRTLLGAAPVRDGRATVRIAEAPEPGRHRLRLVFDGARGFADAVGHRAVRVVRGDGRG